MTMRLNRRAWLAGLGAGLASVPRVATRQPRPPSTQPVPQARPSSLALDDFQPRSMLVVPQHPIERAKFPVVDVHTHPTGRTENRRGSRAARR